LGGRKLGQGGARQGVSPNQSDEVELLVFAL
jgi:hypothetical protein